MTATKAALAGDQLTRALLNMAARGERTHCSDVEVVVNSCPIGLLA